MSRRRAFGVGGAVLAIVAALLLWRGAGGPEESTPAGARPAADTSGAAAARPSSPTARPVAASPAAPGALDAGCAISGTVISSATGAAIPRAQLTFSRSGEADSVDGRDDGTFCFEPRQAGRWTLASAVAPGFLPFAPEWGYSPVQVDVREGARVGGVTVALTPELQYAARVVDPAGRPVAGAEVRVIAGAGGETAGMPLPGHFVSDANGAFQFSAPDGSDLQASHPSYGPGRARLDVAARLSRRVTIALTPPGYALKESLTISGRVDDASGNPAVGALVVAYSPRSDRDEPPRQATADAEGHFAIAQLTLGAWRVVASRPGFAPAVAESVRAGTTDVALRLRAGGRLRGTVRDRGGAAVYPFTLSVRRKGRDRLLPPRTLAVLDPGGQYEVDGLLPGPALVSASAPGRSPSQEVEVAIPEAGAAPAVADLELGPGSRVIGVVLDAATGAPLAGARVEADAGEAGPSAIPVKGSATSATDGRFAIDGVPGGQPISIYAHAEGHHARVVTGVGAPDGVESALVSVSLAPLAPGEDPRVDVGGLGAMLAAQGTGALRVMSLSEDSAAAQAGLAPGDEVVGIEGLPVAELSLDKALRLMRDAEGSSLVLAVRKAGDAARGEQRVVVHPAISAN
jgi:hypothetical protein